MPWPSTGGGATTPIFKLTHYRPLGVAALEDKIVQKAVVDVILTPIYEEEFLGISYGFRPGRGAHDALDALAYAIERRKVNWILDADIRGYFDSISRDWLARFVEHRIALPALEPPRRGKHRAPRQPRQGLPRSAPPPLLLETFVQSDRFVGTSYRAANWIHVGQTQGRGKLDVHNQHALPKNDIWLYPLRRDFRRRLCAPLDPHPNQ